MSSPDQCQRTVGSRERSPGFEASSFQGFDRTVLRQHDCGVLSPEGGGDFGSVSQCHCSEDPSLGRVRRVGPSSPVHLGEREYGGGCPLPSESGHRVRMGSASGGIRQLEEEVVCDDRPVRNLSFSSLSCLFCSHVGPYGCGNRRHVAGLESFGGVCLSSDCHDSSCTKQVKTFQGDLSHVDRPFLANQRVVPGSVIPANRTSDCSSSEVGPVKATTHKEVSPKVIHASASCVETLERFARASGFSSRVARRLSHCRRRSSLASYQSKWLVYRRWCWDKGHSVSNPTIPKISEFLLFLWSSRNLSLSAIKGYRSMLSAVFSFKLPEISHSFVLRKLIRSFEIEKPRSFSHVPSWDLDIVLKELRSEKYEPLKSQDLRTLTLKTLFLVALATAKRVGELQALSNVVSESGKDLILSYVPFFVAKTESRVNPLPRSFRLASLEDFAPGLDEESLLCPVRALRFYMKRTKGFMRRGSSLFVSPSCPTRSISKNAVSFFLRKVISDAGALREGEGHNLRAHSVRGIATSTAFLKNCSISRLLEAATWRSNSVFSSFYFRDNSYSFEGLRSLGPFVAAGSVINH